MSGTASPWVGSELLIFDVVFLVIGLPSIVHVRLGFQDLVFGDISFYLLFPLCSLISLQISSLLASLMALPFAMFSIPCLDSVFLYVCFVGFVGCFWSQAWAMVSW
ncbi:hypothetical protein Bca101_059871 [Brassica carinata]